MRIEDVLANAIRMEVDGYEFYRRAQAHTASNTGKAMYNFLADYELHHKKVLEALMLSSHPEALELEVQLPKDRLRSVFADMKDDVPEHVDVTSDDIDALSLAMEKETESYKMYKEAAGEFMEPRFKAVFDRLALEESQHYEILEKTRYYLRENANWQLWEDGGPIEGG